MSSTYTTALGNACIPTALPVKTRKSVWIRIVGVAVVLTACWVAFVELLLPNAQAVTVNLLGESIAKDLLRYCAKSLSIGSLIDMHPALMALTGVCVGASIVSSLAPRRVVNIVSTVVSLLAMLVAIAIMGWVSISSAVLDSGVALTAEPQDSYRFFLDCFVSTAMIVLLIVAMVWALRADAAGGAYRRCLRMAVVATAIPAVPVLSYLLVMVLGEVLKSAFLLVMGVVGFFIALFLGPAMARSI